MSDKLKKVLICSDSFGLVDPDYPNLHFSEKILNTTPPVFELHNLSHGGDSNALIVLQLMQGLQFNPDFVILSFTSPHRHEVDKQYKIYPYPTELTLEAFKVFRHNRYNTTIVGNDETDLILVDQWNSQVISSDFEILKNYFLIHYCLQTLEQKKIPFCFSLGGLGVPLGNQDYNSIIDKNYIKNQILTYSDQLLKINLWNHNCGQFRPYFHVSDDSVQEAFANECLFHLKKASIIP
jgi:hypothetical protein